MRKNEVHPAKGKVKHTPRTSKQSDDRPVNDVPKDSPDNPEGALAPSDDPQIEPEAPNDPAPPDTEAPDHADPHKKKRKSHSDASGNDGHPKAHPHHAKKHSAKHESADGPTSSAGEETEGTHEEPPAAAQGVQKGSLSSDAPDHRKKKHSTGSDNQHAAPGHHKKSSADDHKVIHHKKTSSDDPNVHHGKKTSDASKDEHHHAHKKHKHKKHKDSKDEHEDGTDDEHHDDDIMEAEEPKPPVDSGQSPKLERPQDAGPWPKPEPPQDASPSQWPKPEPPQDAVTSMLRSFDRAKVSDEPVVENQPLNQTEYLHIDRTKNRAKQNLGPIPLFLPKIKKQPQPERRKDRKKEANAAVAVGLDGKIVTHIPSHATIKPQLFHQDFFWKPEDFHVDVKLVDHTDTSGQPVAAEATGKPHIPRGLEFLEETCEFNVFMRHQPLDCDTFDEIHLSSFNVLNEHGETIYFIAENQKRCFCNAPWSHFLPIYSVTGELLMIVLKRNVSCLNLRRSQQMVLMKEMQLVLRADALLDGKARKPQDARPNYHLYVPSRGTFVGHFVENEPKPTQEQNAATYKYNLYDGHYNILHYIDKVKPQKRAEIQEGDTFDPMRIPYFKIYRGHNECGVIHPRADFRRLGIKAAPETCYHAEFPADLPAINKAVLLGFMAVTQLETLPVEQDCCTACCMVTCCAGNCTIT